MKSLPSLSLAGMELRRFLRGRLPAAALAVLAVIPLLYGALYLYAFWDPYGHLDHVPAALVMEDRAATATDGSTAGDSRWENSTSSASVVVCSERAMPPCTRIHSSFVAQCWCAPASA